MLGRIVTITNKGVRVNDLLESFQVGGRLLSHGLRVFTRSTTLSTSLTVFADKVHLVRQLTSLCPVVTNHYWYASTALTERPGGSELHVFGSLDIPDIIGLNVQVISTKVSRHT